MKYGYCRVSTRRQGDGNSLEAQRELLVSNGAEEIFEEAENRLHAQKAVLVKLLKD